MPDKQTDTSQGPGPDQGDTNVGAQSAINHGEHSQMETDRGTDYYILASHLMSLWL